MTRLWSAIAGLALVIGMAAYLAMPSAAATRRPGALPITEDGITITQVTGGGTGTSGPLTVVLSAASGDYITSVSATLTSADGNTTIGPETLALAAGSTSGVEPETWSTGTALEAPAGSYTVSLVADDSGGDTFSGTVPGVTLSYLMQPTISNLTASSSISGNSGAVDFENQTVTISGSVSGMLDNVTQQLADTPLAISEVGTGAPSPVVIYTDENGNFTYPMTFVPLYQSGTNVQVEVLTTEQVAGGTTTTAGPITVEPDSIQVTASTSAPSVQTGGQLTVTGIVSYQPQAGPPDQPAPGVAVEIEAPGQTGSPLASGTTGTDGSYSLTFAPSASGTYDVYAGDIPEGTQAYPDALYFSGGSTSFSVAIRNPVSLGSWQPSIDYTNDQLTASVCEAPATAATAAESLVEYAPNVGGPWSSLGGLSPSAPITSPDCNVGGIPGILMTGSFPVPIAAGFYQASFPGSPSLLPGTSSSVYVANVVSLANWHLTVNADGKLAGSACVAPVAAIGRSLEVVYSTNSKSQSWDPLGTVEQAAGGRPCRADGLPGATVTVSLKAQKPSAYYELWYLGTSTLLFAASSYVYVSRDLTRITNLTIRPGHLSHSGRLTITGRLEQYVRGWKAYSRRQVAVIFEYRNQKGSYYTEIRATTSSSGSFKTSFVDNRGSAIWSVQYIATGDATHYACTSNQVLVTVG